MTEKILMYLQFLGSNINYGIEKKFNITENKLQRCHKCYFEEMKRLIAKYMRSMCT